MIHVKDLRDPLCVQTSNILKSTTIQNTNKGIYATTQEILAISQKGDSGLRVRRDSKGNVVLV